MRRALRAFTAIGIYCLVVVANTVFVKNGLQTWAAAAFEVATLLALVVWNIRESDREDEEAAKKHRLSVMTGSFCQTRFRSLMNGLKTKTNGVT